MTAKCLMSPQITSLGSSVIVHLRNITRVRRFLDKDTSTCHPIVRSLVLSRLDYGNALLLGSTTSDKLKLQRLQNWASKLIHCANKYDHATPFLKQLHWLPVKQRFQYKTLCFVYKCLNDLGPAYFKLAWFCTHREESACGHQTTLLVLSNTK